MQPPRARTNRQIAAAAALIVACYMNAAEAASTWEMPLEDLVAIATGNRQVSVDPAQPVSRHDAIRILGYRPVASVAEETKVSAALGSLLASTDNDTRKDAASALGQRGCIEFVPQLFGTMDCDPSPLPGILARPLAKSW